MADVKKSSIQKKSGCYLLNVKQPERTAKRLKLSFQRIHASINSMKSERKVNAAVGFVDLSETGAGFFTSELLPKGCAVEVCITEPQIIKIRALVAWSVPIESGLHASRFPCRSGLQFLYDNDVQRQAMREFLDKISSNPIDNLKRTPTEPSTGVAPVAAAPAAVAEAAPAAAPTSAAEVNPAAPAVAAAPAPAPVAEAPAAAPVAAAAPAAEAPKPTEEGGGQSQAA